MLCAGHIVHLQKVGQFDSDRKGLMSAFILCFPSDLDRNVLLG
jgi:hypothetical protein